MVQAVENKQQAVEQIKSGQQYDIYLLDVWLPDGNGFDICHEIRKISQAIVMFLTSCDDEESITKDWTLAEMITLQSHFGQQN